MELPGQRGEVGAQRLERTECTELPGSMGAGPHALPIKGQVDESPWILMVRARVSFVCYCY